MASVNSFETDMRKLRKKRKRKRIVKNLLGIFAVIAVAATVFLSRSLWLPYFEGILERNSGSVTQNDKENNFPIDISKRVNVDIDAMDDCWTLFSDTSFATCNADGEEYVSVYLPYSNPVVETAPKRALIYDMGGYNLCVMSRKNQIFTKKLENQILFANLGSKGNVAVVTATEKYPSYLTVFDKNGTEVFHWADGNRVTGVALDDSGHKLLVACIYASGGSFKTVASIIDITEADIKAKTTPIETLCLGVEFTSDGGFWLIGDQALYRFDSKCALEYSYSYGYDLSGFAVKENVCALMFDAVGNNSTYVSLFKDSSDNAAELSFGDKINHMDIYGGKVYICTPDALNVYDTSGKSLGTLELETEYVSFAAFNDNVFFAGYRSINKQNLNTHN